MSTFRTTYPTPLERQFARFYHPTSLQFAHLHKNNSVCLVGLSPTHPAVLEGVVSVEFSKAALSNEALGKRKRGALGLRVNTPLCTVTTASGSCHEIRATVNCDLVEINARLAAEPGLVSLDPEGAGFLCVGLTRAEPDLTKCFPGFEKKGNALKFIDVLEE